MSFFTFWTFLHHRCLECCLSLLCLAQHLNEQLNFFILKVSSLLAPNEKGQNCYYRRHSFANNFLTPFSLAVSLLANSQSWVKK